MEIAFLVAAGAGGTVLVCQFLLGLLGLGSDHDVDHDHGTDHGPDHHDHGSGSNWFAGLITLRTITAGLTFFGLGGMSALYAGATELIAFAIAAACGIAALAIVAQVMKALKRLKSDGAVRIDRTIGAPAVVYLAIPANDAGPGKVTVTVQKRTVEYAAFTKSPTGLPTGAKVRIVGVRGAAAVEVEGVASNAIAGGAG